MFAGLRSAISSFHDCTRCPITLMNYCKPPLPGLAFVHFRDRLLMRLPHVFDQLVFPRKSSFANSEASRYWTVEQRPVRHVSLHMAV